MGTRQILLVVAAGVLSTWSLWAVAGRQQPAGRGAGSPIPIDADDIAGVVTSARGPEAGVWVIAETTDTPTKFRKIVVTDDRGRYLLPDLPAKATFTHLGPRVRTGRLRAGPSGARPHARADRDRRARCSDRGAQSIPRTTGTR